MQYKKLFTAVLFFTGMALLCGCSTQKPQAATDATPTSPPNLVGYVTQTPDHSTGTGSETPVSQLPPTDTPTPTVTPTPTATPTPTPTPTPIPTVPPAPVALNTDIKNTYTFLVNREYPLSETYAPSDLVAPDIPFSFSDKTADKRKLRKVAADALEDLYHAALNEEGLKIYGVSGYRSYDRQYDIYGTNLINKGLRHTNLYSAAPGTSEHQTGLAIDVSCASIGYSLTDRFASTPEGIWLKENCWRFGFILRYPKEKESITGYAYEPWHIRYVGVPLAYYLHTTGLTLDEYYGTASRYTLTELATLPLIDTATDRFYNLYASVKGGALLYLADGTLSISAVSGYPHVILPITNAEGTVIKLDTTTLYLEPVYDALGNLMLTEEDTPYFKKPYFDAEGNLWLKYNNEPVFLEPLFRKDGTLAKDAEGNVLYTEPVTDGNGNVFITADGDILPKLPIRENGELTYDTDGFVLFYEPYLDPETGEFFYDQNGLPFFSAEYYLALEEENSAPSEQPEEENTEQPIDPDAPTIPEQPSESEQPDNPDSSKLPDYTEPSTEPSDEFGTEGYPVG